MSQNFSWKKACTDLAGERHALLIANKELLEALENAEQYQIFAVKNSTGQMQLAAQYDLDKTRAALAKAEGTKP